jgi:HEAT repeat protein
MAEDLGFVLERLADESRPVRLTNLAPLSDVSRSQMALFRAAWAGYSPERRFELIRELLEQAETNIHFNFYAILREVLLDPDARIRKMAIDGLWEDNRAVLVALFAKLTQEDPAPEVRSAAAMALGRFVLLGVLDEIPDEAADQAERALWAAWRRPGEVGEVRRRALEGLAYINQPDVRDLIRIAYDDEDDLLRQSAIYAMGRSAEPRWSRYVLAELESRNAAMRFEAATTAAELALPAAVTPLVRLLDDADSSVREAAAAALGQIGGPAAKRALQIATESPVESLALAAEAALEELNFNSEADSAALFDIAMPGDAVAQGHGDDFDDADFADLTGLDDLSDFDDLTDLDDLDDDADDFEDDTEWDDDDDAAEDAAV